MFHSRRLEFLKTAKQRLSESHSFVYKLDVDVAVVAGNIQRFFSTIFICLLYTSAFSADMGFERMYGRRATRRRRYYNGRIECEYHIFEDRH